MAGNWTCVTVEAAPDILEELAGEVAALLRRGVELTDTGFKLYLEEELPTESWQPLFEQALRAVQARSHIPFPEPRVQVSLVPGEDWAANWKKHFKPLRVGKHLLICPTWEEANPAIEDVVLRIDPGRAFGTGHHETTRLCLEWLEAWNASHKYGVPATLLDLGTGSGILAMAGVRLGFQSAIGVDNDPEAIEVASENVAVNGLQESVKLALGSLQDIADRFDVVVANIQAGPLVALADDLVGHLKSPGWLVLSGILVDQEDRVREVYESKGIRLLQAVTEGEWCLLVFSQ